jgi:hypothetical protein
VTMVMTNSQNSKHQQDQFVYQADRTSPDLVTDGPPKRTTIMNTIMIQLISELLIDIANVIYST